MNPDLNKVKPESLERIREAVIKDENFHKMILTMEKAKGLGNPLIITLCDNLKGQPFAVQKQWITYFYQSAFQMLSLMNMAANNVGGVAEFEKQLAEFVKVKK